MVKRGTMLLMLMLLATPAWALDLGKAPFSWGGPVEDATPSAAESYTIKCGGAAGGPYTLTKAVIGTPPPTTLPVNQVVTSAGTYFCVVTASNAGGEGPPSNEVSFPAAWSPSPPQNLQVQ